jgi:hypothetical protein
MVVLAGKSLEHGIGRVYQLTALHAASQIWEFACGFTVVLAVGSA